MLEAVDGALVMSVMALAGVLGLGALVLGALGPGALVPGALGLGALVLGALVMPMVSEVLKEDIS